jgi:uncharacterized protein GlcG (DUF336 family)
MAGLTLAQANRIIAAALAQARTMQLAPLGVAVLDAGGHLIALQREDGLSFLRVRVCQAKAYSALAMGAHTRHLATRYEQGGRSQGFFGALNALAEGGIVTVPGGVLVKSEAGEVLGAVGISGAASEDDETCAVAGIEAAGFTVRLDA